MSTNSTSTNCEPDHSVALLNDVHDLIANHISIVNSIESTEHSASVIDSPSDVLFDPQFSENELNFCESKSAEQTAGLICSKILDRIRCENCEQHLLAESEHPITSTQKYPSINFIGIFNKIFEFSLQSIPFVASENGLKKSVIDGFKKVTQISELSIIGCVDHNEEIMNLLLDITVSHAIIIFCKNTNDILKGRIKDLPPNPNPIQQSARTFYMKKSRIGKH